VEAFFVEGGGKEAMKDSRYVDLIVYFWKNKYKEILFENDMIPRLPTLEEMAPNLIHTIEERGIQKGKAEGLEEGIQKGLIEERRRAVLKLAAKGFSPQVIAETLEYDLNEVLSFLDAP
jgi:predicted transposase YdaD